MFKKLLLILALTTSLFAQVTWSPTGVAQNSSADLQRLNALVYRDSIFSSAGTEADLEIYSIITTNKQRLNGLGTWSQTGNRADLLGRSAMQAFIGDTLFSVQINANQTKAYYKNGLVTTKSTPSTTGLYYTLQQNAVTSGDTIYVAGSNSAVNQIWLAKYYAPTNYWWMANTGLGSIVGSNNKVPMDLVMLNDTLYLLTSWVKGGWEMQDTVTMNLYRLDNISTATTWTNVATIKNGKGRALLTATEDKLWILTFSASASDTNGRLYSYNTTSGLQSMTSPSPYNMYYIYGIPMYNVLIASFGQASTITVASDTTKYIRYYKDGVWSNQIKTNFTDGGTPYGMLANTMAYDSSSNKLVLGNIRQRLAYGDGSTTVGQYFIWTDDILLYDPLTVLTPSPGDIYTQHDTVNITWSGPQDNIKIYYSTDNGFAWTYITSTSGGEYSWINVPNIASDEMLIRLTTADSGSIATSDKFSLITQPGLNIISPLDSISTLNIGDNIIIAVSVTLLDSFSIFYSINDTLHWHNIAVNLVSDLVDGRDTVYYNWTLPNIYGKIYLLATTNTSIADSDITARPIFSLGENIPAQPAVCWWDLGGNIIEQRRYNDPSCLWVATSPWWIVTTLINDYGDGYDYETKTCTYPGQGDCRDIPLYSQSVWLFNSIDTTEYHIGDFYDNGDTLYYKQRRYYIGVDTILYSDDLLNGIEGSVVADLKGRVHNLDRNSLTMFIYNVQRSKIQGDTLSISTDFESLNDSYFKPIMLISGPSSSRGDFAISIELLDKPLDNNAYSDIATMFTSLSLQRDYFRGIDPKARKKDR